MQSYIRRKIDVTLQLANNQQFTGTDANTLQLTGLRVIADLKKVGGFGIGTRGRIKIYGMKQDDMNKLSMLSWSNLTVQKNTIIVSAGTEEQMTVLFGGTIVSAWADYSSAPDVALVIEAIPGFAEQLMPADPLVIPDQSAVADQFQKLAGAMGLTFQNYGVSQVMGKMTLKGSLTEQVQTLARATAVIIVLDHQTLSICPSDKPMQNTTDLIPRIAPDTGLVGYPAFHKAGISFSCLFDPAIKFMGMVEVASDIEVANGQWRIIGLDYQLESEKPGGGWFCQCEAMRAIYSVGNEVQADGDQ